MEQVHKDRLMLLVKKLREIPPEKFNYSVWVESDRWMGHDDLSCGAPACALGWACVIPELRELGLRLMPFHSGRHDGYPAIVDDEGKVTTYNAWETSEQIFGLTRDEHIYLFESSEGCGEYTGNRQMSKIPPTVVADKIQRFIDNGTPSTEKKVF